MKKIATVVLGIMFTAINLNAQEVQQAKSQAPQSRFKAMNQKAKTELNLDEKQVGLWDGIQKEYKEKFVELRNSPDITQDERRAKAKGLMQEKDKEILAILNSSQQTKYETIVKQNRAKARKFQANNSKGGNNGKGVNNVKAQLNLSDEQSKKWSEIAASYKEPFQEIRNNTTMDRDDKRAKAKSLRNQLDSELLGILDAGQQEQFKLMIEKRNEKIKARNNKVG